MAEIQFKKCLNALSIVTQKYIRKEEGNSPYYKNCSVVSLLFKAVGNEVISVLQICGKIQLVLLFVDHTTNDVTTVSVHCQWSSWSVWSSCTLVASTWQQSRTRMASLPFNGGMNCVGGTVQNNICPAGKLKKFVLYGKETNLAKKCDLSCQII